VTRARGRGASALIRAGGDDLERGGGYHDTDDDVRQRLSAAGTQQDRSALHLPLRAAERGRGNDQCTVRRGVNERGMTALSLLLFWIQRRSGAWPRLNATPAAVAQQWQVDAAALVRRNRMRKYSHMPGVVEHVPAAAAAARSAAPDRLTASRQAVGLSRLPTETSSTKAATVGPRARRRAAGASSAITKPSPGRHLADCTAGAMVERLHCENAPCR